MGDRLPAGKTISVCNNHRGQLSLLSSVGRYNEYHLSGWVMIINGDGGYGLLAAYIGWPTVQASWLGRKVGGHLAPLLYLSREPSELSQ